MEEGEDHVSTEKTAVTGKWVFLSGPITGMPDGNREEFARARDGMYGAGAAFVFNPAEQWREDDGTAPEWGHAAYMAVNLHELTSHGTMRGRGSEPRAYYDLVVTLPGWRESPGSCMEVAVAADIGIPVLELADALS